MKKSRGPGPTLAKDINRKLVYRQIKQQQRTTRVEIARLLRLNKNTVNTIIAELMASGFVNEAGQQTTHGAGRKPIEICFRSRNKWAIGVQITSTIIHWVVTDLYASPIEHYSIPLHDTSAASVIREISGEVHRLITRYGKSSCIGVGIGIPGLIEPNRSHVIHSSHMGWKEVSILSLLKEQIDVTMYMDNSVKLASLGELWHGSGKGLNHFIYCNFGNGVGCSMIADGTMVRGESNAAGELGHFVIEPDGPLCGCGNRGCLEAVASIPALIGRVGLRLSMPPEQVTMEWVHTALSDRHTDAAAGITADTTAIVAAEIKRTGQAIGQALSYVANLLNPRLIICDGPLMQCSAHLFPIIHEELRKRCLPALGDQISLVRSKLYPFTSGIGAAAHVVQTWEETIHPLDLVAT